MEEPRELVHAPVSRLSLGILLRRRGENVGNVRSVVVHSELGRAFALACSNAVSSSIFRCRSRRSASSSALEAECWQCSPANPFLVRSTERPCPPKPRLRLLHRASSPCQSSVHALRSEFSHVSQHYRKLLFPFGYVLSFTFSDSRTVCSETRQFLEIWRTLQYGSASRWTILR